MLRELFNCPSDEIIEVNTGVYRWRGIFYELVIADKLTAPDSHYTKFDVDGVKWAIREVGKKSKLLDKYLKR